MALLAWLGPLASLGMMAWVWSTRPPSELRGAWLRFLGLLAACLTYLALAYSGVRVPPRLDSTMGLILVMTPASAGHVALAETRWPHHPLGLGLLYGPGLVGHVLGVGSTTWTIATTLAIAVWLVAGRSDATLGRWIGAGVAAGATAGMVAGWTEPSTVWLVWMLVPTALAWLPSSGVIDAGTVAVESILAVLPDALMVFDRDGRLHFANDVARQQYGMERSALLDQLFRGSTEGDAFRRGPWARALAGVPKHGLEMTLLDRRARPVTCLVSMTPVESKGRRQVVMLAHDVAAMREAAVAEAAEQVTLGTPTALAPWFDRAAPELLALIGTIRLEAASKSAKDATRSLRRLMNDIMELSGTESERRLIPELIDLRPHLAGWTSTIEGLLDRITVDIDDGPVPVWFDPTRLRRTVLAPLRLVSSVDAPGQVSLRIRREGRITTVRVFAPDCPLELADVDAALRGVGPATIPGHRFDLAISKRLLEQTRGRLRLDDPSGALIALSFHAFDQAPVERLPSEQRTIWQ